MWNKIGEELPKSKQEKLLEFYTYFAMVPNKRECITYNLLLYSTTIFSNMQRSNYDFHVLENRSYFSDFF